MIRSSVTWVFALLLPVVVGADESRSALAWLNRMSTAAHTLNYEGRFVYEHDGRLMSMQLYHGLEGNEERERLVALNGASREVIRNGGKVTCILPDNGAVVVEDAGPSRFPIRLPGNPKQLDEFYSVRVEGAERIAGNKARKIVMAPRDPYRYGQSVWLDEDTGLLLKAEVKDEKGLVIERLMFTSLKVHERPLPSNMLESQSTGKDLVWYPKQGEKKQTIDPEPAGSWKISTVPAGFREELRREHVLPGERNLAEQHVLSDGLASVSVFVEPANGVRGPSRLLKKGALNAYVRYTQDHKVTVLGDVPVSTVRLIGDGVVPEKEPGRD